MTDKKIKKLIILLGVLLALLICYIGIQTWNKKQDEKAAKQAEEDTIYMTDISDVTAVTYNGGQGDLSFAKDGDTWYATSDKEFPLDASTLKTMIDTYSKLVANRELTDGDDLASYGLDQPAYYISLTDGEGNVTTINIGNTADEDYYAMVGSEGTVYTIPSSDIEDLQTTLEDMASLDTFPSIGSGNIVSEEIKKGGGTTKYENSNTDDAESIATVVGGLSVMSLDTPVNYHVADSELETYGLEDGSRTTVTVVYTDDDEKEQTAILYIGKEDGEGNCYVQLDGSKIVYTITTGIRDNILNVSEDE